MSTLFRGSAYAVLLFASIFVLYSGSYFVKTQKKEIAIYSLLGMRKIQIAFMMFWETLMIGLLAIFAGICIGTLTSGFFTSLLARFMAIGEKVSLTIEPSAIWVTTVMFLILFIISSIKAYRTIYHYNLIDLFSATKQSEGTIQYSIAGAIISIVLIGIGYTISRIMDIDVGGSRLFIPTLIGMVCVIAGTFLLFRNVVPMLIEGIKKRKNFYYRSANLISVSQISFRLRINARMLSMISLLAAVTITLISASYSFYDILAGEGTKAYAPYSFICKNITEEQHRKIQKTVSDMGDVKITCEDKIELLHITLQNDRYAVKDQQSSEIHIGQTTEGYLLSQSMYQRIIENTDTSKGDILSETKTDFEGGLTKDTCYFIDGNAVDDYCKELPGQKMKVSYHNQTFDYTITGVSLHKYIGALDLYKQPTIVVSDETYNRYYAEKTEGDIDVFYAYQFNDDLMSEKTVNAICSFIPERFHLGGLPGNMSYIGIYKANFALFGSYAFIGFFLGTLFLLASGSVMYYKQIMEAQEEIYRYEILHKLGMKRREALASVAKQLGFVYGIPLCVGLLHTWFALRLYNRALGDMGAQTPAFIDAIIVVLLFILVYGFFYLLSVRSYYKIIWKKN